MCWSTQSRAGTWAHRSHESHVPWVHSLCDFMKPPIHKGVPSWIYNSSLSQCTWTYSPLSVYSSSLVQVSHLGYTVHHCHLFTTPNVQLITTAVYMNSLSVTLVHTPMPYPCAGAYRAGHWVLECTGHMKVMCTGSTAHVTLLIKVSHPEYTVHHYHSVHELIHMLQSHLVSL